VSKLPLNWTSSAQVLCLARYGALLARSSSSPIALSRQADKLKMTTSLCRPHVSLALPAAYLVPNLSRGREYFGAANNACLNVMDIPNGPMFGEFNDKLGI
jgi:hypothetical protein